MYYSINYYVNKVDLNYKTKHLQQIMELNNASFKASKEI